MKTLKRLGAIPTMLAIFFALSALAAFADPPSRVVRLKYMSGEVSVQPGGVNDWVAAVVNRPLTTSDRVWTDKNSRAELTLGSASLRANAESSLTFTNVSDDIVQVEFDQGTLNLHIRHLIGDETYEIDTPNLAFTILKSGDYRFDVDPNADTTYITVWHGEGEATGQGPGVKIHSGEQASFSNGTSLAHQTYSAPDRDGFDDWCQVRTDREDHADSYRYVSADVIGADDLDSNGTWRTVPQYGPVWVPAVAPGWAPYHYGHWVWVEPWGWTWVDDAAWGFAPAHYGRWVFYGGFWAWSPGPPVVAVRPVYAPALVAWVGGPHFGVSIGFGGGVAVGWFPLGWGEPYVPAYSVSRTYFQQVNVTNTHITNITNVTNNYYINNNTTVVNNNVNNIHYVNQNVAGAVTAVPQRSFTNSEPVAKNAVAVNASQLKQVSVATAAPVAPVRNSVLGANAGKSTVAPPQSAAPRAVVAKATPPARPIPFEAKQEVLAKNPGRPLDAQTESNLRATLPKQATNTQPATPNRGMSQPNPPAHPGTVETPAATAQPHPSTPAAKPAQPAVAETPAAPGRNVPRPPSAGGNTAPNETVRGNAPATPAAPTTPAAPVHSVPRPPAAGGSTPAVTSSSPRQPEKEPAVVNQRPANSTQRDQPQIQQAAHHSAPFEQARPQQPAPIYTPHAPHEDQRPPQHEQTKAPAHTQTQHEAPREHSNH